jgi:hypothetical protein
MHRSVGARFKAWVYGRLLVGIAGSNPTGGMEVCLLCVVRCQVEDTATGRSLVQGSTAECVCVCVCVWYWVWSGATITLYSYSKVAERLRKKEKKRKGFNTLKSFYTYSLQGAQPFLRS